MTQVLSLEALCQTMRSLTILLHFAPTAPSELNDKIKMT